jgi:hypothetical protein
MNACTCQGKDCGCDTGLHGLFSGAPYRSDFLGALTADAAAKQVFPNAPRSPNAGHNMDTYNQIVASVQAGLVGGSANAYMPGTGDCSATGVNSDVKLAQTASGLALTGVSMGLLATGAVTAAALAPWTMGISALIGIFPIIMNHHAQAVKKEQSVLCAAVPAANNTLRIIEEAVQAGYATPQHAIDALNSLYSDFNSKVSSIRHGTDPNDSGECNAACVLATELHAIVLAKQSEYQDLIDAAAVTVTPNRPNVTSPAGSTVPASSYSTFYAPAGAAALPAAQSSSGWLPIAAMLVAGYFLLKGS